MTNDQDPRRVALDAIPNLRQTEQALADVKAALAQLRPTALTQPADIAAQVVQATLDGQPVPAAGLAAREREAAQAVEDAVRDHRILTDAAGRLTSLRDQALRAGADNALAALRPLLADVLDQVRRLAPALEGITSADRAIAAGVTDQWRTLGAAVDQYARIRAAHKEVLREAVHSADVTLDRYVPGEPGTVPLAILIEVTGEFANVDELLPEWHTARAGRPGVPPGWADTDPAAPWPHTPGRPLTPVIGSAYLLWLARSEARPWVPTLGEMVGAYVEHRGAVRTRERQAEEIARYGRARTTAERQRTHEYTARRNADDIRRAAARAH